jgi:hypothetical protein
MPDQVRHDEIGLFTKPSFLRYPEKKYNRMLQNLTIAGPSERVAVSTVILIYQGDKQLSKFAHKK